MCGVDNPEYVIDNCGIDKIRTLWDILDELFFLHVDGYDEGYFSMKSCHLNIGN